MHFSRLAHPLVLLLALPSLAPAAGGNRLTYLDEFCDPYYAGLHAAKLTTPQWVGQAGVEAVIVPSIDDLDTGSIANFEGFLRPILERLKRIDGRAPVSILTKSIDYKHPQVRKWLAEGVSLEAHTWDHPCPCLHAGKLATAKHTYDRCVDLMTSIEASRAVAFRMPCCDSMNSLSPRFFAEIFNRTTPAGAMLSMDSSVFNLITPNDAELPREWVFESGSRQRFRKYLPADRNFANWIEDYPYPFVVARLCWELPMAVPSDWQAQHLHRPGNPITIRDWQTAIDATVLKQGAQSIIFHPHNWIRNEQIVELIDRAVAKHGSKIKFLSMREVQQRLTRNLLGGQPLRAPNGQDNGVRVLDLNNDGYMDVVVGNENLRQTRTWSPRTGRWTIGEFPVEIVDIDQQGNRRDAGVRFGVLQPGGLASMLVDNEKVAGLWHFDGRNWVEDPDGLSGLEVDGPVKTAAAGRDRGVRLRDLDRDGVCELIVANDRQNAVFRRSDAGGRWLRLPFGLPVGTSIVDARGRDAGLRFVDPDGDGDADVVFSDAKTFAVHLFTSISEGWSHTAVSGKRDQGGGIPAIVRADGSNNGAWFKYNHMWVQNEDTGGTLPHHVDLRHYTALLGTDRDPPPRSPQSSLESIRVLDGFRVELVAAEPLVMDPVDIGWGPDGKLWVVEMADYPLGEDDRGKPCGRVRFLEDTDADGRYDKSTVFLAPIAYPTGIMPWRNGVLVTAAPEVFYAEDTDGDGRCDLRQTLFAGFGQGNQQHRVNHPRWGLDNWVHVANGDSGGRVKSQKTGQVVDIGGRDLRFKPDEGLLDPQTGQAQFGTNRDDWGNWFGCNNPNPGWHYVLADHYLRRNPHVAPPPGKVDVCGDRIAYPVGRVISHCDLKHRPYATWGKPGRWTSIGGVTIYRDELFGPEFTGNLFVNDSVYNVVHRRILRPQGVTFTGHRGADEQRSEFLASHDTWFRNATVETGPDGALWIVDMYRFVIEHPEWINDDLENTLDLRLGHDRGRIYRVYPVHRKPRRIPRLDKLDTAGLVAALDSPNGWQRDMAQQMLIWRNDKAAADALEKMATGCKRPLARLHALCTLDGLGVLRAEIVVRALEDERPGVRRHAVRLSESLLASSPALGEALSKLEDDADLHLAMQLAYSLGEWDDPRAGEMLGRLAIRHAGDRYLSAAVMSSAARHAGEMIAAVIRAPGPPADRAELLGNLLMLTVATKDRASFARALEAIATKPDGGFTRWQFDVAARLLDGLDRRKTTLAQFAADAGEELAPALERAGQLFDAARTLVDDENAPPGDRAAALRILGRGPDRQEDDLRRLVGLLVPQTSIELQLAVVDAVKHLREENMPELLLRNWSEQGPRLNGAVADALMSRPAWIESLLDRIEDEPKLATILGTSRRDVILHHPSETVRQRAGRLLGTATAAEKIRKSLEKFKPVLKMTGDPARGKKLFEEMTCADCHRLDDVGEQVTTDLTTLVDKSPGTLLAALIDPNRAVEDKYIQYTVLSSDGLTLLGMLLEETGTSITLADSAGKSHVILRKDVEELVSTGRSHMPEGLEEKMDLQQAADLFAFIARSGPPRREVAGNRPRVVTAEPDGSLILPAAKCEIYGPGIKVSADFLVWFYKGAGDRVIWSIDVARAGRYEVWIEWAQIDAYADNPIAVEVQQGSRGVVSRLPSTGGWGKFRRRSFGVLDLQPGPQRIVLRPNGPAKTELSDIRGIRLVPIAEGTPGR